MNINGSSTRRAKRPRMNNTASRNNYNAPLKNRNSANNNTRQKRIRFNSSTRVRPINKEGHSIPVGNRMRTRTRGPSFPSGNVSNNSTRAQFIASAVGHSSENRESYNKMANAVENTGLNENLEGNILNRLYRYYHNFANNSENNSDENNAAANNAPRNNARANNARRNNRPVNSSLAPPYTINVTDEVFNLNGLPPWGRS